MKVAIIGAGLAGLSCAYELEKHNIRPTIFEKNSFIGEEYSHVGATLEIISRPIRDPVSYFTKKFGLEFTPLNTVNSVIHHAPKITTEVKGNLGYFFVRSQTPDDMKNQLYAKLKNTEVRFSTYGDYVTLSEEYDYVVIANGNSRFANELGCWFEHLIKWIVRKNKQLYEFRKFYETLDNPKYDLLISSLNYLVYKRCCITLQSM